MHVDVLGHIRIPERLVDRGGLPAEVALYDDGGDAVAPHDDPAEGALGAIEGAGASECGQPDLQARAGRRWREDLHTRYEWEGPWFCFWSWSGRCRLRRYR